MPSIFCGIDVGTQGARCAMVRDDGEVIAQAEAALEPSHTQLPKGWFEQEPSAWLSAVCTALSGAIAGLDTRPALRDHVVAVSVTSTSGTLCVLDAEHRPLVPAIMYNDTRSRYEDARRPSPAGQVHRAGAAVADALGYRFGSSFGLPKIYWLKERRPEIFEKADLFLSPTDYVIAWLTGEWRRSDETNMLKFGYDLLANRWPAFIEKKLGIPIRMFPAVQKPGEQAGRVTAERAAQTGLAEGTPVAAGMTDGCASQMSSGAVAPGQYCTTIGTTMVVKGVSKDLLLDPAGRVYCHRHPEGWWLPGGASNTGAECLAEQFGPGETEERGRRALDVSPTDLVIYPLVGRGERFPFLNSDAEGFVLGDPRGRDELFAAHLEGVACLERLAYETLAQIGAEVGDTIYSAGGGARSDAWLQIRADTLRRTVRRAQATGAATGAAVVAASMEHYDTITQAAGAMVRIETEVEPRPDRARAYEEKYARFRKECVERGYIPADWPH